MAAQAGLRETLKKQNYFLACSCYPDQDLIIADIDSVRHSARVRRSTRLFPRVVNADGADALKIRMNNQLNVEKS